MSDWLGSLEEHVDNDVSGQGITEDELERRWSGEFRVIPEPVIEPEMPDWMKAESDALWQTHRFDPARYGR